MTLPQAEDQPVFRQDRSKQIYIALGSVAFPVLGWWILFADGVGSTTDGSFRTIAGWLALGCGPVILLNAIGQLVRPAVLTLAAGGFTVQHWRGRQDVRWQDVAEIRVWSSLGTNMVTWRLKDGVPDTDVMAGINALFDYNGALGTGRQVPARSIVARMNEFKARFEAEAA